jgi:hypothetical protein
VGGTEGGGDGTSTMVSFGKMLRYDDQRYLLLIRENGIDETTAHDTNLATAYPDNSLIWIDATTGAPLGLAQVFGVHPVTVTGQASQNDYYHEWGIAIRAFAGASSVSCAIRVGSCTIQRRAVLEPLIIIGAAGHRGTELDGLILGNRDVLGVRDNGRRHILDFENAEAV